MPRDSSGNYSLPSSVNPVLTGTTIASTWANTTLNDLAVEMTDSLDRSGKGGMLAAFKLFDGTVGAPGLSFVTEPTTGFYRVSAGHLGITVGGSKIVDISAPTVALTSGADGTIFSSARISGTNNPAIALSFTDASFLVNFSLSGTTPVFQLTMGSGSAGLNFSTTQYTFGNTTDNPTFSFVGGPVYSTGNVSGAIPTSASLLAFHGAGGTGFPGITYVNASGATNNKVWDIYASATGLNFRVLSDNQASSITWLDVERGSGLSLGSITFGSNSSNSTFSFYDESGISQNIGFRDLPQNSQNGNYTTILSDRGKQIFHNSGAAHTYTIAANSSVAYPLGTVLHFVNVAGGGALTIAINSDTLTFMPSNVSGSRTLSGPGSATAEKVTSTIWYISGVNLA